MKKSELTQIIREEITKIISEGDKINWNDVDPQLIKKWRAQFFDQLKIKDTYTQPGEFRILTYRWKNGTGGVRFEYSPYNTYGLNFTVGFDDYRRGSYVHINAYYSNAGVSLKPNPEKYMASPVKFKSMDDLTPDIVEKNLKKMAPVINKYYKDLMDAKSKLSAGERSWYAGRNPGGPQSGGL